MMRRLGATEFETLRRLEEREPFGEYGAWLRTALLCTIIVNMNRAPGSPPAEIDEFMPVTMRSERPEADTLAGAAKILKFFETISQAQEETKAS